MNAATDRPTSGAGVMASTVDSPLDAALADRLRVLSEHVARLVDERRRVDADPDNPYRGLYVHDDQAVLLADERGERAAAASQPGFARAVVPGIESRLGQVANAFGLDALDLDLLVVALAPDLEPRFERLYGYLHDDLTRRRATIGLALELTGLGFSSALGRSRFIPQAPLVRQGILAVEEPSRGVLTRSLRVSDRIMNHLLADDHEDAQLRALRLPGVTIDMPDVDRLAHVLRTGIDFAYLQDGPSGVGIAIGASAMHAAGLGDYVIDLGLLPRPEDAETIAHLCLREARLRSAGLVVVMPEGLVDAAPGFIDVVAESGWPTVVVGPEPWNPSWTPRTVLADVAPRASVDLAQSVWARSLPELTESVIDETTRQLRLRPDQIVRAAVLARHNAAAASRSVNADDLASAARAQNSARLERLARRIRPTVSFGDLVVSPEVERSLRELEVRYRTRDIVHGSWGLGGANNRRLGVVGLFAGPSGVGKTMAAEALAGALGLDLYQVNLATVVDKYIGETEKNLERIFAAAEGVNGVILFDEADALFGKRSEVSDAKDRYANVEVAYLLQRLETYEGVAVLATNLRTNIDEAFTRRLDSIVDFAEPNEEQRNILWDRCLGQVVQRSDDIDLSFIASRFRLSGGNIRNVAIAAAFFAVARDQIVTMEDLMRATAQEYRKLGRMCTVGEFGPWLERVVL